METILENGEELEVTNKQARQLETDGFIYKCKDTECGFWHICDPYSFVDIEAAIS